MISYVLDTALTFYIGYKIGSQLDRTFWWKTKSFLTSVRDAFNDINERLR